MLVLSDEFTLNSALEKMRFDIKRALLDARKALLELPAAVCPRKSKSDKSGAVPSMYECNSWTATTEIPWNTEHERALTPAEGITKLGAKLQQCEFELRLVHNELAAIRGSTTDACNTCISCEGLLLAICMPLMQPCTLENYATIRNEPIICSILSSL